MRTRSEVEDLYQRSLAEDGPGALSTALYRDMLQRWNQDQARRFRGRGVWARLDNRPGRDEASGTGGRDDEPVT